MFYIKKYIVFFMYKKSIKILFENLIFLFKKNKNIEIL
jgi:hypothetical protein